MTDPLTIVDGRVVHVDGTGLRCRVEYRPEHRPDPGVWLSMPEGTLELIAVESASELVGIARQGVVRQGQVGVVTPGWRVPRYRVGRVRLPATTDDGLELAWLPSHKERRAPRLSRALQTGVAAFDRLAPIAEKGAAAVVVAAPSDRPLARRLVDGVIEQWGDRGPVVLCHSAAASAWSIEIDAMRLTLDSTATSCAAPLLYRASSAVVRELHDESVLVVFASLVEDLDTWARIEQGTAVAAANVANHLDAIFAAHESATVLALVEAHVPLPAGATEAIPGAFDTVVTIDSGHVEVEHCRSPIDRPDVRQAAEILARATKLRQHTAIFGEEDLDDEQRALLTREEALRRAIEVTVVDDARFRS